MIVLISGGTAGIGAAIAEQMHKEGHRVFAGGRRVVNQISTDSVSTLKMDVTNKESVNTAIDHLIKETGQIDVLIQCAGRGAIGPLEEFQTKEISEVFDLNLYGILRASQAVLPHMRRQGHGKIIMISSLAAEAGLPYQGVYCASKAALDIMVESLRMEIKTFGIEACVLQPGDFKTEVAQHRQLPKLDKQSPYFSTFERINTSATTKVETSDDPSKVAQKVSRILKKKRLKPKYRVGAPIELVMPVVKRILPAQWFEALLMKYYNL